MLRILKYIFKAIGVLMSLAIIYVLFASFLSIVPVNPDFKSSEGNIPIYVRSNGVHTDIFLPVRSQWMDWSRKIPYQTVQRADSSFNWIGFGWGNREFYIETKEWKDLSIPIAVRAGCGIGRTAMHIEFVRAPGRAENWYVINLKEANMEKLVNYIEKSFETDSAGNYIPIPRMHYYSHDAFFEATGRFTIFKPCNEWTGEGLRQAGIRMGAWTPFEKSVVFHLK